MFFGSDEGGRAAAVLYSILASAKANQVEPFTYVRDLIATFASDSESDVTRLLPTSWLTTHPDARRNWSR